MAEPNTQRLRDRLSNDEKEWIRREAFKTNSRRPWHPDEETRRGWSRELGVRYTTIGMFLEKESKDEAARKWKEKEWLKNDPYWTRHAMKYSRSTYAWIKKQASLANLQFWVITALVFYLIQAVLTPSLNIVDEVGPPFHNAGEFRHRYLRHYEIPSPPAQVEGFLEKISDYSTRQAYRHFGHTTATRCPECVGSTAYSWAYAGVILPPYLATGALIIITTWRGESPWWLSITVLKLLLGSFILQVAVKMITFQPNPAGGADPSRCE